MDNSKRSPWITVAVIGLILVILCVCAVVLGGVAAYFMSGSGSFLPESIEINMGDEEDSDDGEEIPVPSEIPQATRPAAVEPPTVVPPPTEQVQIPETAVIPPTQAQGVAEPAAEQPREPVEPPSEEAVFTGKQERTESRLFDDFSSDSMDWYQYDSDDFSTLIENGVYNIHVKTADQMAWTEFPVDFIPYEFSFDVRGPAGEQDGAFGAECNYLDDDNLYYVEFDLATNEYTMAAKKDGVITPLTKKNSQGQYWWKASALKSPATAVNHIAVSCYLDSITLFVNDKLVYQAEVKDPLPEPGVATLYVYTYRSVEGDGYKVTFDNLEAYQPRQ